MSHRLHKKMFIRLRKAGRSAWYDAHDKIEKLDIDRGEKVTIGVYKLVETKRVTNKIIVK